MSFKRRLQNLEGRPFRMPIAKPKDGIVWTPQLIRLQRKLCLPLPEAATEAERAECLQLMQDITDTGGLDEVQKYAVSLHRKYGTVPFWGEP